MPRPFTLFVRGLSVACALVIVGYWVSFYRYRAIQTAERTSTSNTVFPIVGLKLDFSATKPILNAATLQKEATARQLLLVSSDTCGPTRAMLPKWLALIQTLPFGPRDSIEVVSLVGTEVPGILLDAASKRGVPLRAVKPNDAGQFVSSTGLVQTPGTFALDADSRIQLVIQALDETAIAKLGQFFLDGR